MIGELAESDGTEETAFRKACLPQPYSEGEAWRDALPARSALPRKRELTSRAGRQSLHSLKTRGGIGAATGKRSDCIRSRRAFTATLTPFPLCDPSGVRSQSTSIVRGYRFARPPANFFDPFGVEAQQDRDAKKSAPSFEESRFFVQRIRTAYSAPAPSSSPSQPARRRSRRACRGCGG